jgi:hypothetical protein
MDLDFRTMQPKPFMEIYPVTVPLDCLEHQVMLPKTSTLIIIPGPSETRNYPVLRPSYETSESVDISSFGPTEEVPLGSIVHARSGDKADNSNVGFFVRHPDE